MGNTEENETECSLIVWHFKRHCLGIQIVSCLSSLKGAKEQLEYKCVLRRRRLGDVKFPENYKTIGSCALPSGPTDLRTSNEINERMRVLFCVMDSNVILSVAGAKAYSSGMSLCDGWEFHSSLLLFKSIMLLTKPAYPTVSLFLLPL